MRTTTDDEHVVPQAEDVEHAARLYLRQVRRAMRAWANTSQAYRAWIMAGRPLDPRSRQRLVRVLSRYHETAQVLASLPAPPDGGFDPLLQQVWKVHRETGAELVAYSSVYLRSLRGEPVDPAEMDAVDTRVQRVPKLLDETEAAFRAARQRIDAALGEDHTCRRS